MMWLFAVLIVLSLGGVAAVASGRVRPIAEAHTDRPDALVPAGRPLTGDDLRAVRFTTALAGYRMDEVDTLLSRLADQLDESDQSGRPGELDRPARPEPGDQPAAGDPRAG
jgi:DivIVA domain-containing protein